MKPFELEFEIPGLPKLMNQLLTGHWTKKYKHAKEWKKLVYLHTLGKRPEKPLKKAELIFTRYSSKQPDFDGLCSSFKHITDGLIEAGIIVDDKPSVIGSPEYRWEKCKPKQGKIKVEVKSNG